ncbi:MAG: cell division protein FtsZ [Pseudomonadota bacterium]
MLNNLRINASGAPQAAPSASAHRELSPVLKVIGVGGGGGNAVQTMIDSGVQGIDCIICNTDAQAMGNNSAHTRIQLGRTVTGGMGAGARPDIGRAAAEESLDEIIKQIEDANMVFITAGMGGGTGTGAAPVIAKACRDLGILTVGVVTKPFQFEGSTRMKMAEQGIEEMQEYVDTLIVIPNQNLFRIANEKTTFAEAFKMADSVLQSGVRGITDLIVRPGLINLDFSDVRSVMTEMGKAVMGTGEAVGDKRALEAAEKAISNPLLDDVSMRGAKGVIINVTGGLDMTLYEVDEACNRIRDEVDPEANIIFGSSFDESLAGTMRVSVVATGIDKVAAKAVGGNVSPVSMGTSPLAGFMKPLTERTPSPKLQVPTGYDAPTALAQPRMNAQVAVTVNADSQATAQNLRGTLYKDSFIPPMPIDAVTADVVVAAQPAYNPASVTQSQQPSFETPVLNLAPATMAAQYAPQQAKPRDAAPAPVTAMSPPAKKEKGPSLLQRLTGGGWKSPDQTRQWSATQDSFDAPAKPRMTPSMPAAKSPGPSAQAALNIETPVKPATSTVEDELDIPAFLRRQVN